MFLKQTVEDILAHIEADTEIIIVADGSWPLEPIPDNPRITMVHHLSPIGQRAATNEAAKLSTAKYIMKVDAHCAFDQGFDRKLMEDCQHDWTVIPRMYNLHAFDWVCSCGHRLYQGPTPEKCEKCGGQMTREIVWKPRLNRRSDFYRFDRELHFQYWGAFENRPEAKADIAPTMSCLGAAWFMERTRYWELDGMDEAHGSWGQMGTELACKSWLSGGQMVTNKKTWFAHMFRTQGGDFSFPYPITGTDIGRARKHSQDLWRNNKWKKAKYDLNWLIQKFSPVPDWNEPKKGIVYYTCNVHKPEIDEAARQQLTKAKGNIELVAVSLNKELDFGDQRITMTGEKSPIQMHKQVLAGLEKSTAEIVFLCESDVLYHPSHFDFVPPRKDVFYYNEHTYKVNYDTRQTVFYYTKQVSGCCAYRELLLEFFRKRIEIIERDGFNRHYEPGQKSTNAGIFPESKGGAYGSARYMSEFPNVDIRHDNNISRSKWRPEDFRDPNACQGWKEVTEIPGWGDPKGVI